MSTSMTILVAPSLTDAKRQAVETIEAEGIEAVRLWAGGQDVIEVRRPESRGTSAEPASSSERGERMLASCSEGATVRVIAEKFGLSAESIGDALAETKL